MLHMNVAKVVWMIAVLAVVGEIGAAEGTPGVEIDWPAFMAQSDLVWDRLPKQWHEGAFMGNGLVGAMLYSPDGKGLGWRLGRTDVQDRTNRIPIGWFRLEFGAAPTAVSLRQGLYDAEISGEAVFAKGSLRWRTFTHATKPLIVVEIDVDPGVEWS